MVTTPRQCFWLPAQSFRSQLIKPSNPPSTRPFDRLNLPTSNSVIPDVICVSLLVRYMDEDPHTRSAFFKTETNNEPVRNWLQFQTVKDKKRIGEDIKTVQFGWPLGVPLVRHIDGEIWEIRCRLSGGICESAFCTRKQHHDIDSWIYQETAKDTQARFRFSKN